MIGRISLLQRFTAARENVIRNQTSFAKDTMRLNTGQRLLNNYDNLSGARDLVNVTGKIQYFNQLSETNSKAYTELELAESAINSMKNILDQIKADALQGSSGTVGDEELIILGNQLRGLGENIYQLANSKLGNKHLFGGIQSDKPVISFVEEDLFGNAIYKSGAAELGERSTNGIDSSVSLGPIFSRNADTAKFLGTSFTSPLVSNAEINIVVNDGSRDINVGDVVLDAGDDINDIVTKINNAFLAAGGLGSIVESQSGSLSFNTSFINGNIANADAAIIISPGANLPNSLSSLGLNTISVKGVSRDLRQTLNELDSAYNSGDNSRIRAVLVDIQENIDRLIDTHSKLGDLVSKFNGAREKATEVKESLMLDQSNIARIPVAEAIQKVTASQAVLNSTMQAATKIMSQNVFDFLRM
jgi:flagellin-like hook-associated protein FlgL